MEELDAMIEQLESRQWPRVWQCSSAEEWEREVTLPFALLIMLKAIQQMHCDGEAQKCIGMNNI